ncbi:MAG: type II toxin-antitoxin system RelE/ParE family toxin [Anaerolineae bacterium]|nr:type II toxin-antitoxin system RelE/ParE family toxin [Anaerolineae bacterium]
MYRIVFTKQATRVLRKMSRNTAQLIQEKLEQVAQDPYSRNPNLTKLRGRSGYRLRVGDWRVIYELEDDQLRILVLKIGPRGGVYQ